MQQTKFHQIVMAVLAVTASACALAQVPAPVFPENAKQPALIKQVAPVLVGSPAANAGALPSLSATNVDTGTLRRVEALMRDQAESDIRNKNLRANAGAAQPVGIDPAVLMNGAGQAGAIPLPGVMPFVAGKTKTVGPLSAAISGDELSGYQTVSVINFNGNASADVMINDTLSTLRIGDKIGGTSSTSGWVVKSISVDGVVVEKASTGKKGVQKFVSRTLQASTSSRMNPDASRATVMPLDIIPPAPVVRRVPGDSTAPGLRVVLGQ